MATSGNTLGRPPTQGPVTRELPGETTLQELGNERCKHTATTATEEEKAASSENERKPLEKGKVDGGAATLSEEPGPAMITEEPPTKQSTAQTVEDRSSSSGVNNEPASEVNRLQINFYGI